MHHKSRPSKVTYIIQDAPPGVDVQVIFDPGPAVPFQLLVDPTVDATMHLETLVGAQRVGLIFIRGLLEQGVEVDACYQGRRAEPVTVARARCYDVFRENRLDQPDSV
jgi:hypothetical protein